MQPQPFHMPHRWTHQQIEDYCCIWFQRRYWRKRTPSAVDFPRHLYYPSDVFYVTILLQRTLPRHWRLHSPFVSSHHLNQATNIHVDMCVSHPHKVGPSHNTLLLCHTTTGIRHCGWFWLSQHNRFLGRRSNLNVSRHWPVRDVS